MMDQPEDENVRDIYRRLLPAMSRAGRRVDIAACLRLARLIQDVGHAHKDVRQVAKELGLDPKYLPRKRT